MDYWLISDMRNSDAAWAAGFFDGEGCISWQKSWKSPSPILQLTQTDRRPLERFIQSVGCGKLYGPRKGHRDDCKKRFDIQISKNKDVGRAITVMWPYMSPPKREQFNRVVDYCINNQGQGSVSMQRREANKIRCKKRRARTVSAGLLANF